MRVPVGIPFPTVRLLNLAGDPLVVNGVPVVFEEHPCMERHCTNNPSIDCLSDADCPGGTCSGTVCEVGILHPPASNQRWIQFQSNAPIPPTPGDGSLQFKLQFDWEVSYCKAVRGRELAQWLSDNRDDLYGSQIADFFGESAFPGDPIPAVSMWGLIVLTISMASIASVMIRGSMLQSAR